MPHSRLIKARVSAASALAVRPSPDGRLLTEATGRLPGFWPADPGLEPGGKTELRVAPCGGWPALGEHWPAFLRACSISRSRSSTIAPLDLLRRRTGVGLADSTRRLAHFPGDFQDGLRLGIRPNGLQGFEHDVGQAALLPAQFGALPQLLVGGFADGGHGLLQLLGANVDLLLQKLQELQLGDVLDAVALRSLRAALAAAAGVLFLRGRRFGLEGFQEQVEAADRVALGILRGRAGLAAVERLGGPAHVGGRAAEGQCECSRAGELLAKSGRVGLKRTLQTGQVEGRQRLRG